MVSGHNSPQQTTPRKLDLDLSRYSLKFRRQVFNRGLHEQNISQTAFGRLSMNFFGGFFQRTAIRVDSDEEFLRIRARRAVNEKPVSGPNVYNYSALVRGNELVKSPAIQLSTGSAAN